jgi:polyisoprenoid-binding protein YceI
MTRTWQAAVLSFFAGILFASPLPAQTAIWRIDSVHSTARLYVTSSTRQGARINVGVARLSGEVFQNAGSLLPGSIAFQIYPADKSTRAAQPKGRGTTAPGANRASPTLMTFRSKTVELLDAKSLRVRGDLTAAYVSREAEFDPSKGYSGPTYGPPVTHSVKREVTFVFRVVPNSGNRDTKPGNRTWSASSSIPSEAFPELWNAVVTTDWPAFVLGEQCAMPSGVGEDFSGPECKGKVVEPAPRTDMHCAMPSDTGEDFTGMVCDGTPLPLAPKTETESKAGTGPSAGSSTPTMANEVVIELVVQLKTVGSAPPKPSATTKDPTARNYGNGEVLSAQAFLATMHVIPDCPIKYVTACLPHEIRR